MILKLKTIDFVLKYVMDVKLISDWLWEHQIVVLYKINLGGSWMEREVI